jgi:hypothetical protein
MTASVLKSVLDITVKLVEVSLDKFRLEHLLVFDGDGRKTVVFGEGAIAAIVEAGSELFSVLLIGYFCL